MGYLSRHARPCGKTENPADYALDLTANSPVDWAATWESSEEYKATQQRLEEILPYEGPNTDNDQESHTYAASPVEQLRLALHRGFLNYWRDPGYVLGQE